MKELATWIYDYLMSWDPYEVMDAECEDSDPYMELITGNTSDLIAYIRDIVDGDEESATGTEGMAIINALEAMAARR